MSFPLAQDVGYDPSLYTEPQGQRTVLIRHFVSHGESRPQIGFIHPLTFQAVPGLRITLGYRLNLSAVLSNPVLMLVGADGHSYSAALPSGAGEHALEIGGSDLKIAASTAVEAIILRGRLLAPPAGSASEWILEQFVMHAARTPEVSLESPLLASSPDERQVARKIVRAGESLELTLKSAEPPPRLALFGGEGKAAKAPLRKVSGKRWTVPLSPAARPGLWRADLTQGPRHTAFRFLVLGEIPPHPRVLLSQERLNALQQDPRYAGVREQIHRRAEKLASSIAYNTAVGNEIDLMPSGPGLLPAYPGQFRPYMEVATDYGSAVAFNALDYRINGSREALAAARRALLTVAQWKAWAPRRWSAHGVHTYYEVGVFTQLLAFGYDLIAPELSAGEKATVANAFWEKSVAPTLQEYFLYDRVPIAATNHEAQSLGGAIAAVVADAGDVPGWEEREGPALAQLTSAFEQLLAGLFPGDGSEAEPIGYQNFAMQGLSWGMGALDGLGIRPIGARRMFESFWWPYYATAWPGRQLGTGDFEGHLTGLSGFAWAAQHAGIPELQSFYEAGTRLDLSQGSDVGPNGHHIEEMLGPLDLACCSKSARPFAPPPPSRVFPLRGSAALRSGWEANSTVISIRVGPWFNHEHHDEGSFQVAALGEDLIAEAGYANYYTDPRYPDYFTQAVGHNCLLIDGDPFSQAAFAGRYWPGFTYPHFTSRLLTQFYDYLSADLTSAYDGRLRSYRREFVFLKPDILIVRDRAASGQPHAFSWLLHAPPGSDLTVAGPRASIKAKKAAVLLTAAGPNAAWREASDPIAAQLFTDLDRKNIQPLHRLLLSSPLGLATGFLAGMKFVAAGAAAGSGLEARTEPAGEGFRDAAGGPAEVVFRTGPGSLRLGPLASDGTVLASRRAGNASSWLAVGARHVQSGDQAVFTATAPCDVAAANIAGALDLALHNSVSDRVAVFRPAAPRTVEVDGRTMPFTYRDKMVELPTLPPGEHRVSIL